MSSENFLKKNIAIKPKWAYLVFSIPILMAISWSIFYHPLYTTFHGWDFWEYSATIREWTKNLWHPGNPHLAIECGSPRYIPFYFLLTVLAKIFDLTPIQALGIGGVLTMILFLYGIWLFLPLYFRDDWAAFVGLIVLLCGWGAGWYYSNCYQLRCLFYVITYPSSFAFSLCFLSFWLATKMLRHRAIIPRGLFLLGIMSALMLLCHPLTGAFAIGSLCLLALSEPKVSVSHRWALIAVVLTGALAAELWPYFSVWRVILGTSGGKASTWIEPTNTLVSQIGIQYHSRIEMLYHENIFYRPQQILVTIGPSLLGIPALIYMGCKREHVFIVSGLVVMSLPYVANIFYPIPLGARFIFYMIFYLHLALIWGVLRIQSKICKTAHQHAFVRSIKIKMRVLFYLLMLCLLWNVALSAIEFANRGLTPRGSFRKMIREPVVENMKRLSLFIPDESIVLAPLTISWPLPTFTGKVVALLHENPMVADYRLRRRHVRRFFEDKTLQENRLKTLRRYKVTHILFKSKNIPETVRNHLNDFGSVTKRIGDYVIIELRNDLM